MWIQSVVELNASPRNIPFHRKCDLIMSDYRRYLCNVLCRKYASVKCFQIHKTVAFNSLILNVTLETALNFAFDLNFMALF